MPPSKVSFWFAYALQYLKKLPWTIANAAALFIWSSKLKNGIRIIDFRSKSNEEFVATIEETLELIQLNDSRRYARLLREIHVIFNTPAAMTGGTYSRRLKICLVDIQKMKAAFEIDRNYGIQFLACVLIHETTHGSLYSRRVIQTRENYTRVEMLCCSEMVRFAQKLGMDEITCRIFQEAGESAEPSSFLERLRWARKEIRQLR